jgi:tetratricopeptide (TPR) repeat protein
MRSLYFYIILACASISVAQNRSIDSLLKIISSSKEDSGLVKAHIGLGKEYLKSGNKERSSDNFKTALTLSQKFNFQRGILNSLEYVCRIYIGLNNADSSIKYSDLYIKSALKNKNKNAVWYGYILSSNAYIMKGDFAEAVIVALQAIKVAETLNSSDKLASSHKALGVAHAYLSDYKSGIKEYLIAQDIWYSSGDSAKAEGMNFVLGIAYGQSKEVQKGLDCMMKARDMCIRGKDEESLYRVNNEIIAFHMLMGNHAKAIPMYLEAYDYFKKNHKTEELGNTCIKLSGIYLGGSDLKQGKFFTDELYTIGMETGRAGFITCAMGNYATYYQITGDYKKACDILTRLHDYKDSSSQRSYLDEVAEMSKKYESERKDKELLQKDSEIKIEQADAKQKSAQRNILMGGVGALLLLVFLVFRSYNEKKKANHIISEQKKIVDEKQKEVMDSIRYAKRIQTAQIPSEKFLAKTLDRLMKN